MTNFSDTISHLLFIKFSSVKFQQIDKVTYRKHLNITLVACAAALLCLSLTLSAIFIAIVSSPEADNFNLNLMAVVVSIAIIVTALIQMKHTPFLHEVYYVWCLKMELNFINAKLRHIEKAAANNEVNALITLAYYYQGSRQLWTLDDNTISIDSLAIKEQALEQKIQSVGLNIDTTHYQREMLKSYK